MMKIIRFLVPISIAAAALAAGLATSGGPAARATPLIFVLLAITILLSKNWPVLIAALCLIAMEGLWLAYATNFPGHLISVAHALAFLLAGGAITLAFQQQTSLRGEVQQALDLAERRLASVAASEAQYRLAFESANLGFANLTADGILTSANSVVGKITGHTTDELMMSPLTAILPQGSEELTSAIRQLAEGQSTFYSSEFRSVRKDGTRFWVRVTLSTTAAFLSKPSRIFMIIEDISEWREASAALKAEKEWLDLALSAGRLGTWQMDLQEGTFSGSRTFWKILGLTPAHKRKVDELLAVVHPADWHRMLGEGPYRDAGDFDVDIRVAAAGQSERWIALRGRDEQSDGGQLRVGVAADITERRETRLLRAEAKKQEQIVQELRHRLSNLFPVIVSLVDMSDSFASDLPDYKKKLIERIRVLSATHSLLARQEYGSSFIRDIVVQELKPFLDTHDVSISGPTVPLSTGAAESFAMVVHELATNSVKHGALSESDGTVEVRWSSTEQGSSGAVSFEWLETVQKKTREPSKPGFGSSIIGAVGRPLIGYSAKMEIQETGMRYSLQLSRNALMPHRRQHPWSGPSSDFKRVREG